jgi:hypothetical protein
MEIPFPNSDYPTNRKLDCTKNTDCPTALEVFNLARAQQQLFLFDTIFEWPYCYWHFWKLRQAVEYAVLPVIPTLRHTCAELGVSFRRAHTFSLVHNRERDL